MKEYIFLFILKGMWFVLFLFGVWNIFTLVSESNKPNRSWIYFQIKFGLMWVIIASMLCISLKIDPGNFFSSMIFISGSLFIAVGGGFISRAVSEKYPDESVAPTPPTSPK